MGIYTELELGIRDYECFCLGILRDGFKTKEDAYQWIIKELVDFLNLYVDWNDPDSNLLERKIMNKAKSRTEEIQYLGQMLTATTEEDKKRIKAITKRLRQLIKRGDVIQKTKKCWITPAHRIWTKLRQGCWYHVCNEN